MNPVIALVGRPNVGKSTLFNRLTRSKDALVADIAGLTRDRKYGVGRMGEKPYTVVDTGGLTGNAEGVDALMEDQAVQAIDEATLIVFITDAREGLVAGDEDIARFLRQTGKPVLLVMNKGEGLDEDIVGSDFWALGLGEPLILSAAHGRGVAHMLDLAMEHLPDVIEPEEKHDGLRISIIGRPNVGKSTLVNRIIGEERVLAFDMPGTTRDSVDVPFTRDDQDYVLIDTAGMRRRGRINETIEKFSVIKAVQAMQDSNVAILVIDGSEGVTDQDQTLLGLAIDSGRALVIAINKWDNLSTDQKNKIRRELDLKLSFINFAKIHYISALHGTGVGDLFGSVNQAYQASLTEISTSRLTRVLEDLQFDHAPPLVQGRRVKMRYAHIGGHNPPIIVVHGNMLDKLPKSYVRYMENTFRNVFGLFGTPLRIEFKSSENPFEGRKNKLSERQIKSKRRLMSFIKKKEKKKKSKKKGR